MFGSRVQDGGFSYRDSRGRIYKKRNPTKLKAKVSQSGFHPQELGAAAMHSTSMVDKETLACLWEDQEIREVPKNWHVPDVDLRSTRHPAKSESENPLKKREEPKEYQRPSSEVYLRYLRMCFTA